MCHGRGPVTVWHGAETHTRCVRTAGPVVRWGAGRQRHNHREDEQEQLEQPGAIDQQFRSVVLRYGIWCTRMMGQPRVGWLAVVPPAMAVMVLITPREPRVVVRLQTQAASALMIGVAKEVPDQ